MVRSRFLGVALLLVIIGVLVSPSAVLAAPGDIYGVVDTFTVETTSGFSRAPTMCEVTEGIIAISYCTVGDTAIKVKTVVVGTDGVFGSELDSYSVSSGAFSRWPMIMKHPDSDTTFAVFYQAPGDHLTVETVTISSEGGISYVDDYTIATTASVITSFWPISISGDTFAAAYVDTDNDGQLVTIDINSDGTIDPAPVLDTWEYQTSYMISPIISHVDGNIWAIYNREVNDMYMFTTSIATDGTLGKTKIDNHLVSDDLGGSDYINLTEVRDGIWMLVGMMPTGTHRGVQTFTISADGTAITLKDTRDLLDDYDGGETPFLVYNFSNVLVVDWDEGIFSVFFRAPDSAGWVRTYPVDEDGVIGTYNGTGSTYQLQFADPNCWWMYQSVLNPSEGVFLAAYGTDNATPSEGLITSVDMGIPAEPAEAVYTMAGVLPYIFVGIALLGVLALVGVEMSIGALILGAISFVVAIVGAGMIFELVNP
jgi:hypothetical protein